MKFASSEVTEFNGSFASVNVNWNLSAPAAFSFEVPCALSYNEESSAVDIIDSVIDKPTLNEGFALYFSSISSCLSTFTKKPLMNTTPSEIFAIEHLPIGTSDCASTVKSLLLVVSSVTTPASLNPHLTSVSPALNTDE